MENNDTHISVVSRTGDRKVSNSSKTAPTIGEASTASDIAVFVAYYTDQGYTVTTNRQEFKPDGTVQTFDFEAVRSTDTNQASVRTSIHASTHSVSVSESSSTT